MLGPQDAAAFERCIAVGGVAVFPSDTLYGLACEPDSDDAVYRLYRMKGRLPDKPSAVMFFSVELALAALPELGARTSAALEALLPGAVTLLLPNPARRFLLACATDPETLGLRVPRLPAQAAVLAHARSPVLQSSANHAGGQEARRLDQVAPDIREAADLLLDGGELPGVASTVVDLRGFEERGEWAIRREGAVGAQEVDEAVRNISRPRST
ncbi:MAG: L-threonylcarbamoyladenylate synthase [Solirubrobacteraceae bacterium]|nr:L-threonylcarbamoyladenylate synthase [Solirubrobacteraceae bacterium]